MTVFVLAYVAAIPFMNTRPSRGRSPRHCGADIAYFANFLVAGMLYGGYRLLRIHH